MASVVIAGNTSGSVTLDAPAVAGTTVLTLPATSGTVIVGTAGVTSVASGGTGASTTTAYGVLAGGTTSTGAFQNIGTGTTNQVLTSNGPGVLPSFKTAAGGQIQTQLFTASGTWTNPGSVTQARVTVIGGGGASTPTGASGFGGLVIAQVTIPTSPVTVTVGAGATWSAGATTSGGTSSFGPYASATGAVANSGTPGSPGGTTGTLLRGGSLVQGSTTVTAISYTVGVITGQVNRVSGGTTNIAYDATSTVIAGGRAGPVAAIGGVDGVVIVEFVG